MSDLIDRQAVVDHYQEECFQKKFIYSESIVKYIKSLPSAEGTWIPCSKELPEMHETIPMIKKYGINMKSETVIVSIRTGSGGVVVEGCLVDGEWRLRDADVFKNLNIHYEVVAWMPFPEPYIESGE